MQNWDDLRFLLAVYKTGTMSAAARELGTNVATVSRRMDRLAAELGETPFVRTPSGWRPSQTVAGLLDAAATFEGEMRRERRSRDDDGEGSRVPQVRLGCPPLITSRVLLPNMLARGTPIDRIDLEIVQRIFERGLGGNDLVIQAEPPEGGRIVARKLGTLGFGIYRWRSSAETDRWIGLSEAHEPFVPIDRAHQLFGRGPVVRLENFDKVYQASRLLRLPAPLPEIVAESEPALVRLDVPGPETETEFWLLYHQSRAEDPAILIAAEWVTASFALIARGSPHIAGAY